MYNNLSDRFLSKKTLNSSQVDFKNSCESSSTLTLTRRFT